MIPETDNSQEAKSVHPGKPARHAKPDPGRYFTPSPQCWFSRGTAHVMMCMFKTKITSAFVN